MQLEITVGPHKCPFSPWTRQTGRIFDRFAYDTETTDINDDRPDLTPELVIATACNGQRGVYLTRDTILPFFQAHADAWFICHNAAFDLAVTQAVLGDRYDLYALVEAGKVWDTMILKRLYTLATEGHTAQGEASLAACAKAHLGIDLDKAVQDATGSSIRRSFGQYLFAPLATIPADYLRYAAGDALVTWHLFWELNTLIGDVLRDSSHVRGYIDDQWLRDVVQRFGPLTHHVQLKASVICDVLRKNGIAIDQARQADKLQDVKVKQGHYAERLRERKFPIGGSGAGKAMQAAIDRFHAEHPETALQRTGSGAKWSAKEEDIADLAAFDPLFSDYTAYRKAEKLESTYLSKMDRLRLHARFNYLVVTGRMSCSGGFNLQNLPRETSLLKDDPEASSIRGCFVPGNGKVFIDGDYSQIELVVLAYILKYQFKLGSSLHDLINEGNDIHKFIAAAVLDKNIADVTSAERTGAKAVSFGRPGGMGVDSLQRYAKNSFKQELSIAEVEQRIDAYHRLCPELGPFLADEVDSGLVIAETLNLTPIEYHDAIGGQAFGQDADVPQSWLGSMLLKVLRDQCPATRAGRSYTPAEIEFFWHKAQQLPIRLKPSLVAKLARREVDEELWEAMRNWAGRRPVFTVTGRLRANALFGSSRNTPFQGPAADGAILGMWLLWRAGHKLVSAIHDQVVVECDADELVLERKSEIERLMIEGMLSVVPGMNVRVETVVSRSLNKAESDDRYCEATAN